MSRNFRQLLIAAVTFLGGLYFFLEYLLPEKIGAFEFGRYHEEISKGVQVVGVMAIGIGVINILHVHGLRLLRTQRGWANSLALLAGMFITLFVQFGEMITAEQSSNHWQELYNLVSFADRIKADRDSNPTGAAARIDALTKRLSEIGDYYAQPGRADVAQQQELKRKLDVAIVDSAALQMAYQNSLAVPDESRQALHDALILSLKAVAVVAQSVSTVEHAQTPLKGTSDFIEEAFFVPLGSAMFALLAFYIANAAYRSFRVRSFEALVMMLAALVVMLGQIPHGPLYISTELPAIRLWLLKYISTPVFRAIFFGASIAGLAMAVRMWLSLEASPLESADGDTAREGNT